jgi:hypothetical protein
MGFIQVSTNNKIAVLKDCQRTQPFNGVNLRHLRGDELVQTMRTSCIFYKILLYILIDNFYNKGTRRLCDYKAIMPWAKSSFARKLHKVAELMKAIL